MRCNPHAVWSLAGATACLGAMANAAGVLDLGLVFPRDNETYEPAEEFPIVWAIQNARVAELLQLDFIYRLVNLSDKSADNLALDKFQRHVNISDFTDKESGLVLFWTHVKLLGEGPVGMGWNGRWAECQKKNPSSPTVVSGNMTENFIVDFALKKGGKKADLIAAAAANNGQECPDRGFALRVTDRTDDVGSEKCVFVDSSSPTPTANPCRVKIDQAVVESMDATTLRTKCSGPWKPDNCPKKDHATRQLATAGAAALPAALGALYFLLARQGLLP